MDEVKVLLADDHEMMRRGLRVIVEAMPGWKVCAEATNGREAVDLVAKLQPHIVVMDVSMPDLNGVDATRQIKRDFPTIEVLMFSGLESEQLIRDVFDAGARSFIAKTAGRDEVEKALRALSLHRPYFTPEVGEILFARILRGKQGHEGDESEERLSDREREVVQLLAEGSSNKEVADKLGISVKTAESHRAAVMKKLRLKAFSELVRYAVRNNIVPP